MTTFKANFQRTGTYSTTGVHQLRGIKWRIKHSAFTKLLLVDGVLYFCGKQHLFAIDAQSRQALWKLNIEILSLDGFTYHEGIIYFTSIIDVNNPVEFLFAIDVQSQQEKWRFELGNPTGGFRNPDPVIANGVVCVSDWDGHLYGVEQETGQLLWTFSLTELVEMTPAASANGIIYIGDKRGNLYAIDATTGSQQWKCELGLFGAKATPAFVDNVVYIAATRGVFYAIDAETGEKLWQFQIREAFEILSLAIADGIAYVGTIRDCVCAIDLHTQQEIWGNFQPRKYILIEDIAVADGVIYCNYWGAIAAVDCQTGHELWQFTEPLPDSWFLQPRLWFYLFISRVKKIITGATLSMLSYPIIADGTVYVGCNDGYIYALH